MTGLSRESGLIAKLVPAVPAYTNTLELYMGSNGKHAHIYQQRPTGRAQVALRSDQIV